MNERLVSLDDRMALADRQRQSIYKHLTDTRSELHEFVGFVKENMVTHSDLKTGLAATEYRLLDRMDRGFAKRDVEIHSIKSTIKKFHPTAFPKTTS